MTTMGAVVPVGDRAADEVGRRSRLACGRRRERRVVLLLIGIVALSGLDLGLTLHHLSSMGMNELNPLAAALVTFTDSAWALIIFKGATAGSCVGLLYRLRAHLPSEIGAWFGFVVLSGLTIVWLVYSIMTSGIDPAALEALTSNDASWLRIDAVGGVR